MKQQAQEPQKQLSKEFVREWLIANGFQGKTGQKIPDMSDEWLNQISTRYIELYETVTGKSFQPAEDTDPLQRIETNILKTLTAN
jgi:phosphoribosylaminoimidazole-succinocarboxamide synthase